VSEGWRDRWNVYGKRSLVVLEDVGQSILSKEAWKELESGVSRESRNVLLSERVSGSWKELVSELAWLR
jgi:hypothetical protein